MANKAEFLIELAAQYYDIDGYEPATKADDFNKRKGEGRGYSFYKIPIYERVGNAIKRGVVKVQVEAEGTINEFVHWEEKEAPNFLNKPKNRDVEDLLSTFLKNNSPADFKDFEIIEVNQENKSIILNVWIAVGANVIKVPYWFKKPKGSPAELYKIV